MLPAVALITATAAAAPFVTSLGEPVNLQLEGRHARPFRGLDGRWWIGHGRSNSFRVVPLEGDGFPSISEDVRLVDGQGRFIDHTFVPCDDGSWLHVASGRMSRPDDSAWVTAVTPELVAGPTRTLVNADSRFATNDPAALCSDAVSVVGIAGAGEPGDVLPPDWFFPVDAPFLAGDAPADPVDASDATRMTGNSMTWDPATGQLRVFGMEPDIGLLVARYDADLNFLGATGGWPDLPADAYPYWAQGVETVGRATLLAHMMRGDGDGFAVDSGQVALTVLGPDLELLETWQLTEFPPPDGAMRPGIAVDGDLALVTFDVRGRIWTVEVGLDRAALEALGAAEPDDEDDDVEEPDEPVDTAPEEPTPDEPVAAAPTPPPDEGCAAAPGSAVAGLLAAGLLWTRRRNRGRAEREDDRP